MTLQFQSANIDAELATLLVGKTLRGVRPTHDNGPVPDVNLLFTDDTGLTIKVKGGVYFEACLINTLRKAQPVTDIILLNEGGGDWKLELRARTFPLIKLLAVNKTLPLDECPFEFSLREMHGA